MSLFPELLQAALLTVLGGASALRVAVARRGYGEPKQPALFCVLLAFSLTAGVGACGLARQLLGLDTREAEGWLLRSTLLLGLPLIGLVALSFSRQWNWSRPTWGRIVLGLCAFFELTRQLGWGSSYAMLLGLLSALLVAYAGVLRWPSRRKLASGLTGAAFLLAALPWTGLSARPNPLAAYQLLCLALACPFIAWMLLDFPTDTNEKPLTQG